MIKKKSPSLFHDRHKVKGRDPKNIYNILKIGKYVKDEGHNHASSVRHARQASFPIFNEIVEAMAERFKKIASRDDIEALLVAHAIECGDRLANGLPVVLPGCIHVYVKHFFDVPAKWSRFCPDPDRILPKVSFLRIVGVTAEMKKRIRAAPYVGTKEEVLAESLNKQNITKRKPRVPPKTKSTATTKGEKNEQKSGNDSRGPEQPRSAGLRRGRALRTSL